MTTIFYKSQISCDKLKEIIVKNPQTLRTSLSLIDRNLGGDEAGAIDFLGVDKTGRVAIVDVDVRGNDDLLLTALGQVRWIRKNAGLLKRLFFSDGIDFSQPIDIILVCPEFSPKIQAAVEQFPEYDIRLIKFEYITTGTDDAIYFDEICRSQQGAVIPSAAEEESKNTVIAEEPVAAQASRSSVHIPEDDTFPLREVTLSPEEIAEFMDFDRNSEYDASAE